MFKAWLFGLLVYCNARPELQHNEAEGNVSDNDASGDHGQEVVEALHPGCGLEVGSDATLPNLEGKIKLVASSMSKACIFISRQREI